MWEDRVRLEQENQSMIYLDANNKPKSKLDLNDYLNSNKKKDPTIRNQNTTPQRNVSPLQGLQQRSTSLYQLQTTFNQALANQAENNSNNLSPQKSIIYQSPSKSIAEEGQQHFNFQQKSQRNIQSIENLDTDRLQSIARMPTRVESLQTMNSPRSVDQLTPRLSLAISHMSHLSSPKKRDEQFKFNLPLLNFEKLSSDKLLDFSPRKVLSKSPKNVSRHKKSYSEHTQQEGGKKLIFIDSGSNFCTHKKEIKLKKIINIKSTGIDQEALKKFKNVSDQVDNLILSQRYKNYEETLDFYKHYQPATNIRNLYKNTVNGDSFNNLLQVKLAEKNQILQKKDKTPTLSQLNPGSTNSFNYFVKKKTFGNIANLNQINSANQLIQIQSLQKIDDEQQSDVSSKKLIEEVSSPRKQSTTSIYQTTKFSLKEQLKNAQILQSRKKTITTESDETNTNNIMKPIINSPQKNRLSKMIKQNDSVTLRQNSLNKLNQLIQKQQLQYQQQ